MIKVFVSDDDGYALAAAEAAIKTDYPKLDRSLDFQRFDAFQDSLSQLCADSAAYSFSGSTKVFLLTDCLFFTDQRKVANTYQTEADLKALLAYLKSPSPDSSWYVVLPLKAGRNPFGKALKAVGTFLDVPVPKGIDLALLGIRMANRQGVTWDKDAALALVDRTENDYRSFVNEIQKVSLSGKHVTLADVTALVPRRLEDNVFAICDDLIGHRPLKAIQGYRDLRHNGLDPIGFLPVLMAQFRFIALVSAQIGLGKSDAEISDALSCSMGRVYHTREKATAIPFPKAIRILAELGRLETNVKFNLDDADNAMELFFMKFQPRR